MFQLKTMELSLIFVYDILPGWPDLIANQPRQPIRGSKDIFL